jgi:hypothetical protein
MRKRSSRLAASPCRKPSFAASCGAHRLAFHQHRQGRLQAEQAHGLRDAARAGQQAQRRLGKAELDALIVEADAAVRAERELPAATERRAFEAGDHGLAEALQLSHLRLHGLDPCEELRTVLRAEREHVLQFGAGEEGLLGGGEDDAGD